MTDIETPCFYTGDKVIVKPKYLLKIAKRNLELAKRFEKKIGTIVGFDDDALFFLVDFDGKISPWGRFELEKVLDDKEQQ